MKTIHLASPGVWSSSFLNVWASLLLLSRAEIFGMSRIMRQSYRWPEFLGGCREPPGLALQYDCNHIDGTLQVKDARIQNEVIQVGITWTLVVKHLQIAGTLLVFLKDACLSRGPVQAFTAHHIGDTQLKGCHYAHMKDVTPLCQVSLGTTTHDHYMSRGNGPFNDLRACCIECSRIHGKRNFYGDRHCWMNQAQAL